MIIVFVIECTQVTVYSLLCMPLYHKHALMSKVCKAHQRLNQRIPNVYNSSAENSSKNDTSIKCPKEKSEAVSFPSEKVWKKDTKSTF